VTWRFAEVDAPDRTLPKAGSSGPASRKPRQLLA